MDFAICYDAELGAYDLRLEGAGFVPTSGIETAIALSLFLDARADPDDELDDGNGFAEGDPRGWWGNEFQELAGDQYGSRWWLYKRAKLTTNTENDLREDGREALEWFVDRGIARSVELELERRGSSRLDVTVTVARNERTPVAYSYVWDSFGGVS